MCGPEKPADPLLGEGYARLGRPVPHHTGDEVAEMLSKLGATFTVTEVISEMAFPDTEANRERIVRFLFGADYAALPREEVLSYLEAYRRAGRVELSLGHEQFVARAG